jgi:hypothetical protein
VYLKTKRMLDLGCGLHKAPGAIGVDSNPNAAGADVRADLDYSLPFGDDSFDQIRAVHVIEHVKDIMRTMAEIHFVPVLDCSRAPRPTALVHASGATRAAFAPGAAAPMEMGGNPMAPESFRAVPANLGAIRILHYSRQANGVHI